MEALHQLLGFIDHPWKAAVVILAALIAGGGFVVWDLRHELFEYWREIPATLRVEALPAALAEIQRETTANLVAVWSIDFKFNSETFLQGRWDDGKPWSFEPRRAPLITDKTPSGLVLRVLGGEPVCGDTSKGVSLLVKRFAEEGMTRVCLVPVPPERRELLLALIAIGWKKPFPEDYEQAVVQGVIEIALKQLSRKN